VKLIPPWSNRVEMAPSGSLCRALPWQTTGVPQSEMSPSLGFREVGSSYLVEFSIVI
jgi:hypothetical protein